VTGAASGRPGALESDRGTVVVTGDSRGLGEHIVDRLLADGYAVVGLSRSQSEAVERFSETYPERYAHVEFDLAAPEDVRELYLEELKPRGPLVGLVNNAAVAYDDLVTNAQADRLQHMFTVNVVTPTLLTKYVIRDMLLARVHGAVVHVSSVSTATGYKGLSMYASTKGALEAFSRGVAREWGARNIRSNCVAPGFMDTEMTEALDDDQKGRIYARTALKEPTDPDSVAETVSFLLSDGARSITGETVRIDSGTL
jgi:3-oxoacyl-[acyl-carrier protein] reductase